MKRIIICQSVVRCQCCLGLTDSRPCPTPPSLGTFYIITLFFLQSLFVFDQRRPQGWESKSAFLSARFLSCTTESVEQFCLHLLLYTDVTNSQHHLSSWVLQFMVFLVCEICRNLQSERERKWSAFIVFNILTSQTTPTVNSQHHSSILSSTSISRLSCVCNIAQLSENIPSIFLQQSSLSWYFCVEPKVKREDIVNWTNPFFMSIQFCTQVSTAFNIVTNQSDILRRCSQCW